MKLKQKSNAVAVIPALNEVETIGKIIQKLKQKMDVVVVDDGSTDATAEASKKCGAHVIKKAETEGYEAALRSGLIWAKTQPYAYAISIDADGEIDPEHAFSVLNELKGGADLVVGRRHSFPRISERIFSIFANFQWGIGDPLCGLKGYRLDVLNDNFLIHDIDTVGTIWMVRILKKNRELNVMQVDVKTNLRQSESRFGNNLKSELTILNAMFYCLIDR